LKLRTGKITYAKWDEIHDIDHHMQGRPSPLKPMMHIVYSPPYFHKIDKFPPPISAKFINFNQFTFFGLIYAFWHPYFDHDAYYTYWMPLTTCQLFPTVAG